MKNNQEESKICERCYENFGTLQIDFYICDECEIKETNVGLIFISSIIFLSLIGISFGMIIGITQNIGQ